MKTEKYCTKCKQIRPLEEWGYSADTGDGLKCHCKICSKNYNQKIRQDILAKKLKAGYTDVKTCGCGKLYSELVGGHKNQGRKDMCRPCMQKRPLVKVYIPSLRAEYMGVLR